MAGLYISTQPLHALHLPAEAVMTPLPQRGRALAAVLGLLATLALPSLLAAQTRTVRGSVIDSATGQPVQSVSVVVVGTRLGALTTGDGSYIIRGVPAGPQTVRVARIGYVPQTRAIGGTETGEIVANFRIDRSAVQLVQRSEEHTPELQSPHGISYAVFCLRKRRAASAPASARPHRGASNPGSRHRRP